MFDSGIHVDLEGTYGRERFTGYIAGIVVGLREAPCDKCPSQDNCRAERLACADFSAFVATGKLMNKDRTATAATFAALFGDGQRRRRVRGAKAA